MSRISPSAAPRPVPVSPRRRLLAWAAAPVLLLAVLWLLHVPLLSAAGALLRAEDPLARADVVYVLGGDVDSRPFRAAELYRGGLAPRVVLPREKASPSVRLGLYPSGTDVSRAILRRQGVPDAAVLVLERPGGAASTADEAVELRRYVLRHRVRHVIVVTHRWHTRRAGWLMRRALRGTGVRVTMAGAAGWGYDDRRWWRTEAGVVAYGMEYLKWVHNLLVR